MFSQPQTLLVINAVAAPALMLVILVVLYVKYRKTIAGQAATLTAANARIEAIIGNLPGMAYQCVNNFPEYTIIYVSEGSKEFVGYTPEELIG